MEDSRTLPGMELDEAPPHTWTLPPAISAPAQSTMQPGHYPDHRVPIDAVFINYDATNATHCRIGSKGLPVSVCMDMPSKDWRTYDMDVSLVHPFYQMMLDRSFAKFAGKPGSHILHPECAILPQQSEFWVRGPSTCIFHPLDFIRSFQYEWDNGLITSTIQAELREAFATYKPKALPGTKKPANTAHAAWVEECRKRKAEIAEAARVWHEAVVTRSLALVPLNEAVEVARFKLQELRDAGAPPRP